MSVILPLSLLQIGRRQAMHPQGETQLAAVMQIMLNHVPDHPLARKCMRPAPMLRCIHILKLRRRPRRRPAPQTLPHHLPRHLKPLIL